jgi:tripartite-type tricarboxylate transporter receptor subunit TctC
MRRGLSFVLGMGAALFCGALQAQAFPSKPIRVVVPYPPGGSPDVLARTVGQKTGEGLGQPMVIDNRPGAGGIIAAEALTNAPHDGHTLMLADSSVYSINPHVRRNVPYDALRDFTPIILAATSPIVLVTHGPLNLKSVNEFIAFARAKPGSPYGSSGNGTAHHLAMELLKSLASVELSHVPYKGAAQTVPAVIAGDVVATFAGLNTALPQVKAGKINMIAIATGKRSALVPDLPSIAESVPGYDISISLGYFAPARTSREVVGRLNGEIMKALAMPDVQQRLFTLGVEGAGSSPEQYAESIRAELQQYGRLVQSTGARADQ